MKQRLTALALLMCCSVVAQDAIIPRPATRWAYTNIMANTNLALMTDGQVLAMIGGRIGPTNVAGGSFDTNQNVMTITNLATGEFTASNLTATGTFTIGNGTGVNVLPIDVTWFGAIADDSIDDFANIQSAATTAATTGRPLWIPAGTFNFGAGSYTISVSGNLTVMGTGPSSILRHFGRSSSTAFFTITTGGTLRINGVHFQNARFGVTLPEAYYPTAAAPRSVHIILQNNVCTDMNSLLYGNNSTAASWDGLDFVNAVTVQDNVFNGNNMSAYNENFVQWDRCPTHQFVAERNAMIGGHTFVYKRFDDIPKTIEDNPNLKNGITTVRNNLIKGTGSYIFNHQGIEILGDEILIERNKFDRGAVLAGYTPTLTLVNGGTGYANGTAYVSGVNNSNVALTLQTSAGVVTNFTLGSTSYCPTNDLAYTNLYMITQGINTNATINLTAFTIKSLENNAIYLYGRNARIRGNLFNYWGNNVQKPQTITLKGASLSVTQYDTNTIPSGSIYNLPGGWGAVIEDNFFQDDPTNTVNCGQIGTDTDGVTLRNNAFADFSNTAATHIFRISPSTATYDEIGFMYIDGNWFTRCKPAVYITASSDTTGTAVFANAIVVRNRVMFDSHTSGSAYFFDSPRVLKNLHYADNAIWASPYLSAFRGAIITNRSVTSAVFERNHFTNIADGIVFTGPTTASGSGITNITSRNNVFEALNRAHYFQSNITVSGLRIHDNLYRTVTTPIHRGLGGVTFVDSRYMSNGYWYVMNAIGTEAALVNPPFYGVLTATPTENLVAGGMFISNTVPAVLYIYDGTNFNAH